MTKSENENGNESRHYNEKVGQQKKIEELGSDQKQTVKNQKCMNKRSKTKFHLLLNLPKALGNIGR